MVLRPTLTDGLAFRFQLEVLRSREPQPALRRMSGRTEYTFNDAKVPTNQRPIVWRLQRLLPTLIPYLNEE